MIPLVNNKAHVKVAFRSGPAASSAISAPASAAPAVGRVRKQINITFRSKSASFCTPSTYIPRTAMAPRKSVSSNGPRAARASHAPSKVATSSKVTLDSLPLSNLSETITPDYAPRKRPRTELTEDDRDRLIQEVRLGEVYPISYQH